MARSKYEKVTAILPDGVVKGALSHSCYLKIQEHPKAVNLYDKGRLNPINGG